MSKASDRALEETWDFDADNEMQAQYDRDLRAGWDDEAWFNYSQGHGPYTHIYPQY